MIVDKGEHGEPFVAVQTTRIVRVYTITEQEARSVDQQHLMASATLSFGTFCFGMLVNMLTTATTFNVSFAVVLAVVSVAFWSIGGWLMWVRRSLLTTIRKESGIEPMSREGTAETPS